MSERSAITDGGTVAWVFRDAEEAEAGARRLRAAGFADVRLSEGAGTTAEAHVPEHVGMTASDFASTLETAGFAGRDARRLTDAVAHGGALVTLAAGQHVDRALAVLRGETVPTQSLAPVDAAPMAAAPAAVAPAAVAPAAVAPAMATAAPARSAAEPEDRMLELCEEQLTIEKQRSTSEARVHKETVVEQRTITVPVSRERLVIERDGEEPIRIPISGEPN